MPQDNKPIDTEDLRKILSQYPGIRVAIPKTERLQTDEEEEKPEDKRQKALRFDFKPSQIKEYLDRYVIQQDDAKKVLATAVCDHYHHIQRCKDESDCRDYKKQNIILIGPTGVGKTYLVQNIARLIGVPFVKADATKFSETGYVGGDVEDLVRELVHQADGDVGLAEFGIVYLDEIDKIAGASQVLGRDVSGHGVQRGLLKLMEDTEVPLRSPTDIASQMQALMEIQTKGKLDKKTINTKHILFIVSGAFDGLLEIIQKRLGKTQIGFHEERQATSEHALFSAATSVDFIDYGYEAEFIGRLPVIVHCNLLTVDDLFSILKFSEGSLLKQYKGDFLAYGIDAYFSDGGMRQIALLAEKESTGARGLMTVCERIFRDFKYQLPDNGEVREFVVDEDTVMTPQTKLAELIAQPAMYSRRVVEFQIGHFERTFRDAFGIAIRIEPQAARRLKEQADQEEIDAADRLIKTFREFEHGMNLVRKGDSDLVLSIDEGDIEDPSSAVDRWIRESYQRGGNTRQ